MVESQSLTFRRENGNPDDVSSLRPLEGGETVTASEQCPRVGWGTVQLGDAHLNSVLASFGGGCWPQSPTGGCRPQPQGRCLCFGVLAFGFYFF